MRLQKYISNINESFTVKDGMEIIEMIKKDCKPFLREKMPGDFLYRGMKRNIDFYKKLKIRKNRRPKDTPERLHKIFDEEFKKKFGWGARSEGIFCTPSFDDAAYYGDAYLIFPIGSFKFVYSIHIPDLYTHVKKLYSSYFLGQGEDEEIRELAKNLVDTYTDKQLDRGMDIDVEISINCNEYYAVENDILIPIDNDKEYIDIIENL